MDNLHEDLNRVLQGQTLQFATSTASATKEPTMGAFTVPIGIALLTLCCVGGLIVSAASLAEGVITVSDIVQSSSSNRVNLYLAGASICVKLPGKRGASEFIRAAEISAATCGELERYEVAKEGADLKLSADESQEYSKKTITALYSWIHKAPQVVHALIPPEQLVKVIDQYGVRRDDSVSMPPVVGAIATYSVECSPEESVALYTWLTNRYARASVSVNPVLKTQMEISLAAALTRVNRNTEAIEHLQRILYVVDALPSALPSTEAIERDSAATYVNATLPVNDPRLLAAAKRLQDVVLKYPDLLKSAPNTFRWYVIRPAQALMKRGRSEDARMLIVRFLDKVRAGRFAHDADVYENGKFAYELLEEIEAVQEREGLIRKNDLADAKNWLESINPSQHK